MIYSQHNLAPALRPYIETLFHYEHFNPDHSIERVIPTANLHLIFELDGLTRHTFEPDNFSINGSYQKVWLSGIQQRYLSISAHPSSEMLVVIFKSHGGYPLLHVPIDQLTNHIRPAQEILGQSILQLRDYLMSLNGGADKLQTVEQWLMARLRSDKIVPRECLQLCDKLRHNSTLPVTEIMDQFEMSHKHLISLFKKYVGVTPKYFQRIIRFNDLLPLIEKREKVSWTSIAYQCGYADQSHFIKEFKHFSGINPTEFLDLTEHHSGSNFVPLDK